VESGKVEPNHDGELVLVVGSLRAGSGEVLAIPRWGLEAPTMSAGLRVQVDIYQPLRRCSWRRLTCQRGAWVEGSASGVSSVEVRAREIHLGSFFLPGVRLDHMGGWEALSPAPTERLTELLEGADPPLGHGLGCGVVHNLGHKVGLANPPPFPGERPQPNADGSVLYYPRGGGGPGRPELGDVRVSFLHLPCSSKSQFTAVGVQRGDALEAFRYRAPPPEGIAIGRTLSEDFNIGCAGHNVVPCASTDEECAAYLAPRAEAGGAVGTLLPRGRAGSSLPEGSGMALLSPRVAAKASGEAAAGEKNICAEEPAEAVPMQRRRLGFLALLGALTAALEGWRKVLHSTAPEALLFVIPGARGRCAFFARAQREELLLAWRLRFLGFALMASGLEVAFWKWYTDLTLLGPVALAVGHALWVVVLVGAGGFTATTVAAASIFYRPVAALLYLSVGLALFSALFGLMPLLAALGATALSMGLLAALLACHLALPC